MTKPKESSVAKSAGGHTCQECGKSFGSPQGLSLHKTRAHRKAQPKKATPDGVEEAKPKRPYRKSQGVPVRFCPCCGLNLEVLNVAVNLAVKHA